MRAPRMRFFYVPLFYVSTERVLLNVRMPRTNLAKGFALNISFRAGRLVFFDFQLLNYQVTQFTKFFVVVTFLHVTRLLQKAPVSQDKASC